MNSCCIKEARDIHAQVKGLSKRFAASIVPKTVAINIGCRVGKKPLFFFLDLVFWLAFGFLYGFLWFFVFNFSSASNTGFLYKKPKNHLCIFYFLTGSEAISKL
jgi:hypothetical protein